MSMSGPFEANLGTGDDGIPAADPGAGGPEPADGFGIEGEEPDRPEEVEQPPLGAGLPEDPPFRTPDPREVGRG